MTQPTTEDWFQALWADREERIYPAFFGGPPANAYPLTQKDFAKLGHANPDPRFLTHTVLEFPPTPERPHFLYASSGMSNPWGETPQSANPNGPSGLGFEFVLHVPAPASSDKQYWPIHLLHWLMAVQLLVATGDLQGQLLEYADRIPLGGPLGIPTSPITHLLVIPPPTAEQSPFACPDHFQLPSGRVDLMLILGVTGKESAFAETQGLESLITVLRHHEVYPLTDPGRFSAI